MKITHTEATAEGVTFTITGPRMSGALTLTPVTRTQPNGAVTFHYAVTAAAVPLVINGVTITEFQVAADPACEVMAGRQYRCWRRVGGLRELVPAATRAATGQLVRTLAITMTQREDHHDRLAVAQVHEARTCMLGERLMLDAATEELRTAQRKADEHARRLALYEHLLAPA